MPSFPQNPAEMNARAANRARVRRILQSALIHDLRAPLNTATLLVDLLGRSLERLDGVEPAARQRLVETVEDVRREVRRLSESLQRVPSLADPGEDPPEAFDLPARLGDVLDLLTKRTLLRGVRLSRRMPVAGVLVRARPADAQHAVLNLVLNAIDATPRGGEIVVTVVQDGDRVRVLVEDQGPGLPPEAAERIVARRAGPAEGGHGFGLPVAKGLVEEWGGTLRLLPRPGGGTVATLEWPVSATPAGPALLVPPLTTAASPARPEGR